MIRMKFARFFCASVGMWVVGISAAQTPPDLSSQPLSADQIAIYQDFLYSQNANYRRNLQSGHYAPNAKMHVGSYTRRLGPAEFPAVSSTPLGGCLNDIGVVVGGEAIHMLPKSLLSDDMELVDPVQQQAKDRERASRTPDASANTDPVGYLSLSEIVFSRDHHLAFFTYRYDCGNVCGTGGGVVYEKADGGWVPSKQRHCGSYIS